MTEDNEYQKSTKLVVDDAMRTDILGPNLVRVLQDHKPANDLLTKVVCDAITNSPDVRGALTNFVDEHYTKRKGKIVDRAIWLVVGAVVTGVIAYILSLFLKTNN